MKDIHSELGIPYHRLVQDVSTRWNSTLYMLQSIMNQKVALAAYLTENDSIPQITSHQFDIISKIIAVLTPIEDITQSISSETASASIIIPYVRALKKSLEINSDDRGIQTMKHEILASLDRCFYTIETNEVLVLATLLDPCFKDLSTAEQKNNARDLLIEKVEATVVLPSALPPSRNSCEPPEKRPRTVVMRCFDEILQQSSVESRDTSCTSKSVVEQYLTEPTISYHTGNAYSWWANNKS